MEHARLVCLTFDVEPDLFRKTRFSGIIYGIPKILEIFEELEDEFGHKIQATWFICHDKWAKVDNDFPEIIDRLVDRGEEIGLHTHFYKKSDERIDYPDILNLEKGFIADLISSGTHSLREKGYNVVSFRGGNFFLNEVVFIQLKKWRYLIDSSVIPGYYFKRRDGLRVDYSNCVGLCPYILDLQYPEISQKNPIVEFPLATAPFFRKKMNIGNIELYISLTRLIYLTRAFKSPMRVIQNLEKLFWQIQQAPIATLWMHTGDLLLGNGKIDHTGLHNLKNFLRHLLGKGGVRLVALNDAYAKWKGWDKMKKQQKVRYVVGASTGTFLKFLANIPLLK